jgi:hypothetical protein
MKSQHASCNQRSGKARTKAVQDVLARRTRALSALLGPVAPQVRCLTRFPHHDFLRLARLQLRKPGDVRQHAAPDTRRPWVGR